MMNWLSRYQKIRRCVIKWFKHDSDASIDAKLQSILLDYGAAGYGLYWYCVELIAKDIAPKNITFELEHDARVIAKNLNLSVQEVTDMMQRMIEVGLFDISINNKIRCVKLAYRLDDSIRKGTKVDEIIDNFKSTPANPGKSGKIPKESGKVLLEGEGEGDKEAEEDKESTSVDSRIRNAAGNGKIPYKEIQRLYNEKLRMLKACQVMTDSRRAAIKRIWLMPEFGLPTLNDWVEFFDYIAKSRFLTGLSPPKNGGKPFIANFDWILNPTNFVKIIEGNYDR